MALFNCTPTKNLKFKGEQGIAATVDGDTVSIGIDSKTFPEDLKGGDNTLIVAVNESTSISNKKASEIYKALVEGKRVALHYFKDGVFHVSSTFRAKDNEVLFYVPYAEYGNGGTMPGRKHVKITDSGVTVVTALFEEFM